MAITTHKSEFHTMKRRHFISLSALSAAFVSGLGLQACQNQPTSTTKTPNQEDFNNFPHNEKDISELQELMQNGKLTSEELVIAYLDRIEKIDRKGPAINSVIDTNKDALAIARTLDEERKSGIVRGPLHGIPIMLKDNIETADKMMTTAGSYALEGNFAEFDAFVVKKLRDAGAVILAKTNLSEWANFRSTRSSSGWSGRGGPNTQSLCD